MKKNHTDRLSPIVPAKCHFELLALPELLKPICWAECVFHVVGLKYVEAAVEEDFPAMVGNYVSSVDITAEFPVKDDPYRTDILLDL